MKSFNEFYFGLATVVISLCVVPVMAQPSGGPYGPFRQMYKLAAVSGKIYYVALDGDSTQSGESLNKPTTLEAAIASVRTGDAIIMRGGTYRTGNLELNQGITIQPYEDEEPVLKGTLVAANWKNLGNGAWVTKWTHPFPSLPDDWWPRSIEERKTPLWRFNNDMVFIDGRYLKSVGWEGAVDSNSYYIDYDDSLVYIGTDPSYRLVEITAHDAAIVRVTGECHDKTSDRKGYTIRGIAFTQYAYRALEVEGAEPVGVTDESKYGKDVVGTTLENCTITYCSRVGGYFRGDHLTIKHCKISDTRTEGVYVIASNNVLLEGNIFTQNNIDSISGYYPAAVKMFNQCHHAVCRDNLIIDLPNSNGVWYDVGEVDGVFVDNWVEGVGKVGKTTRTNQVWPSNNGFFFEISKGVIVAGNVFVNCDHGLTILNSSNAEIYQNTFVNSMACIGRNGRTPAGDRFGWHSSTGPDVDKRESHIFVDNLLTGDKGFTLPLFFVWQPESLCNRLTKPELNEIDHNVYVRAAKNAPYPLILWSPAQNENCQVGFDSLESLGKLYPQFEANGSFYSDYNGPLFKCAELGNYHLLTDFPGAKLGMKLPEELRKLLDRSEEGSRNTGAYPPVP
ncbi:MAG: right-handed parallel beta-helix repeat-containing protein [Candidatus Kryptoniota bacterium]